MLIEDDFASWIILGMVFVAVVLVVLALAPAILGRTNIKSRLASQGGSAASMDSMPGSIRADQGSTAWARLIAEIEKRGLSLPDTKRDQVAEKLMLAGWDQPYAPRAFVLARTAMTLGLPIFLLAFIALSGSWPAPGKLYMLLTGAAIFGLYLPNLIVQGKADRRKQEILNGFPDTLDLLLVCIEAGLGIDAAFNRVGQEIVSSHPLLAQLFANVSLELRAGRSREVALKTLARKSGLIEIGSFCTLIIQSDKLGASIAQALRVYASEMRESRRMRAEEKAHRIPVLLSIPLVCFMLPTMVSVLMLPAAIGMKGAMGTAESK
ncbi:type II secretion system F family protein [Sandarakinorhabdus sp.]|uniref:type II secretion system F family protein n=1 Tax=Sandarakinorhabdus sp. TaxID=1916663 RepID=UPI00286E42BA|nr:type II secretion system F family protein [Sandarakinorhabdus sp.]